MMNWEGRGKLRSCPLLISEVCLRAPERTWGNPRQPAVTVFSVSAARMDPRSS